MSKSNTSVLIAPQRLSDLRAAAGMSQQQLASEAGVSRATVARLERGAGPVHRTTARALASALHVEVEALSQDRLPMPNRPSPAATARATEFAGAGPRILLCVGGGIAAYKAAELVRALDKLGATVQVAMTEAARHFVGELTFAALTGQPVLIDTLDPGAPMEHIYAADRADMVVIAPATATLLSRLASGDARDIVGALYLANVKPVVIAPTMNVNMWRHPATRRNLDRLVRDGAHIVQPGSGYLACGWVGEGRMAEPAEIADAALALLSSATAGRARLRGKRALVTTGPTREYFDPVRFLSNPSTGKMGFAIAEALRDAGAEVTVVAGPVSVDAPSGCRIVSVTSAEEMFQACRDHWPSSDLFVGAAAVADFTPVERMDRKLKKESGTIPDVTLKRTADIIASLAASKRADQYVVGFAAETDDVEKNAQSKLKRKKLDAIVANDVRDTSIGFGSDRNRGTLHLASGRSIPLPLQDKHTFARGVVERIVEAWEALRSAQPVAMPSA